MVFRLNTSLGRPLATSRIALVTAGRNTASIRFMSQKTLSQAIKEDHEEVR